MILKVRSESNELLCMRHLNARMELTGADKFNYLAHEKGYEGEVAFDQLTESLQEERYFINDLLLNVNHSYFQIDSMIISQGVIYLFEIKNFEGDYYLEENQLYSVTSKYENKNPVDQLKRSATLFRQLLQTQKLDFLVESLVVFINPNFTLYQAPIDQPIIFPTQVNRFLNKLNNTPSRLNAGHKKLAQTLLSLHQTKNPFVNIPEYNFEQLRKGIYCMSCQSFSILLKGHSIVCERCGGHEKIEQAILRNVEEVKRLFPNQKITAQFMYDWCKLNICKKTLSRILKNNYQMFGNAKDTHYK